MEKGMVNSERYMDPTAYIALQNVENDKRKWRPFVYICHTDTGDIKKNIRMDKEYCRFALKQDAIPVATALCMTELLQVSATANRELYEKIRRDSDMCEALRELMKDEIEKEKEQGIFENAVLLIRNLMKNTGISAE